LREQTRKFNDASDERTPILIVPNKFMMSNRQQIFWFSNTHAVAWKYNALPTNAPGELVSKHARTRAETRTPGSCRKHCGRGQGECPAGCLFVVKQTRGWTTRSGKCGATFPLIAHSRWVPATGSDAGQTAVSQTGHVTSSKELATDGGKRDF